MRRSMIVTGATMHRESRSHQLILIVLLIVGLSVGFAGAGDAGDFDEDIGNTSSILAAISDEAERKKANEALMKYQDARARVLNNLLDLLKSTELEENRSSWNNQVGNGSSALSSLADALPPGAKDKFQGFRENEKRMWDHFREAPGFLFSRHQIVGLRNRTAQERAKLDDKWKAIEREDASLDAAIYSLENDAKNNLKRTIAELAGLIGAGIEKLGVGGAGNVGNGIKEMVGRYLQGAEIIRKETAVWKTFINEREVARKIHEEISYDRVAKAMDYASNLSVPGDRKDYRSFKDRAMSILEGHRSKAKEEYEKFVAENKGKFLGSLDTNWFLILRDQAEVDNWKELFDIHTSELDSLLKKHEQDITNLKDSDLKKALKENFDKMTNSSREAIVNWRIGKSLYDQYEVELRK